MFWFSVYKCACLLLNLFLNILSFLMLACALLEPFSNCVMKLNTSGKLSRDQVPWLGKPGTYLYYCFVFSLCFGFVWDTALCRQLLCSHHREASLQEKKDARKAGLESGSLWLTQAVWPCVHTQDAFFSFVSFWVVLRSVTCQLKAPGHCCTHWAHFPRLMSEKQPSWKRGSF